MPKRMTLLAALAMAALVTAGCMAPPKNLDLSLAKKSARGVYQVELVPPAQAPAINQMHSWTVKLATAEGAPVQGAKFLVDGRAAAPSPMKPHTPVQATKSPR